MKRFLLSLLSCCVFIAISAQNYNYRNNNSNTNSQQRNQRRSHYNNSNNNTMQYNSANQSSGFWGTTNNSVKSTNNSVKDQNVSRPIDIPAKIEDPKTSEVKKATNTVTLVVTGEGTTKDEATKNALRSAIEQAFGTFVSANTEVLNDELVQDEIVTITSGNIQKYTEVYYSDGGNIKSVTLQATVSVGNLVSYAKNKGMQTELSGATFLMNKKMRDLNREGEIKAMNNLYKQLCEIAANGLFDYVLSVGDPRELPGEKTEVPIEIVVKDNENLINFLECLKSNVNSIKMSPQEIQEYSSANVGMYTVREDLGVYRSQQSKNVIGKIRDLINNSLLRGFEIKDNLNNSFFGESTDNDKFEIKFTGTYEYDLYSHAFDYDSYRNLVKEKAKLAERQHYDSYKYNLKVYKENWPWRGKIIYSNSDLEKLTKIEIKPNNNLRWKLSRSGKLDNSNIATLYDGYSNLYNYKNGSIMDGSLSTFEYFTLEQAFFNFSCDLKNVNHFEVYNGAQSSETDYNDYARIKDYKIAIITSSGNIVHVLHEGTLLDTPNPQVIKINKYKPEQTADRYNICFFIKSYYRGKYKNPAITEIRAINN